MRYTKEQVQQAFRLAFLDKYGTLNGWEDAFEWWLHPEYKCLRNTAPTGDKTKCKKICPTCLIYSKK